MRKIGEIMIPGAGKFTITEEMKMEGLYRRFFHVHYRWNELTDHGISKRSRKIQTTQTIPDAVKCILSLMTIEGLNNITNK